MSLTQKSKQDEVKTRSVYYLVKWDIAYIYFVFINHFHISAVNMKLKQRQPPTWRFDFFAHM